MRVGILTISDRSARGERADASGPAIREFLLERLAPPQAVTVVREHIVPDDLAAIRDTLIAWCDGGEFDLILTTGGTGFAPRDVTPEATRAVIERETPGIPEALRAASLAITRHAMLSRAVAGIRARTLIINLPGSPKAVRENLENLVAVLPHAIELLRDAPGAEGGHRKA